tara:strand:- start:13 stop:207 length:195 start_codon:yes stop_codon:yes gene_type:complete
MTSLDDITQKSDKDLIEMMGNECLSDPSLGILMLEKFLGFQTDDGLRVRSNKLHQKRLNGLRPT